MISFDKYKNSNVKFKYTLRMEFTMIITIMLFTCLTVIMGVSIYYTEMAIEQNTKENTISILMQSSSNIDEKFNLIDNAVSTYICTQEVYSFLKKAGGDGFTQKPYIDFYRVFSDIQYSHKEIESIHLVDLNGNIYGYPSNMIYQPLNKLEELAVQGDGRCMWVEENPDSSFLTYVKMYYDERFRPIAFGVVNIRKSFVLNMINVDKLKNNTSIYILSNTGKILAFSGKENETFYDMIQSQGIDALSSSIEKEYCTYVYDSEYNGWKYISITPLKELMKDFYNIRHSLLLASFIMLVIFIVISTVAISKITKPLKQITLAMQEYDLNKKCHVEIKVTHDEIGFMAQTFSSMTDRISSLVEEVYQKELLMKEQQFKMLQAQINPHFLYNTFDMISWTARDNNVPSIAKILKALSNIMRYTINAVSSEVTLKEEIENIRQYLVVQSFRYEDRLHYDISVSKNVENQKIIRLILQPVVENIFVHGFTKNQENCVILINVIENHDNINIQIKNNGQPIDIDKIKNLLGTNADNISYISGMGLLNVNKRLKIHFGDQYGITNIKKEDEWSVIEIEIPYDKEAK